MPEGSLQLDDKYEILGKLSAGGMGAVYKARHRLLDDIRVIKLIQPHLEEDQEFQARFSREARLAVKLRHPNIVQLLDFSFADDGTAYMILEYIAGIDLSDMMRATGRPPISLSLEIAVQTLEALDYLHERGFVHRDISPDNVMLTTGLDDGPCVKLLDLGLARSVDSRTESRLTRTGSFLGKVRYASPESFMPDTAGPVSARSDLYSFAVMLYELLTGRYPIRGGSPSEILAGHLNLPPISFAETDPDDLVPGKLREIVLVALAKNPDGRPASAAAILAELRPLHAAQPAGDDDFRNVLQAIHHARARAANSAPESTRERLDRALAGSGTVTATATVEVGATVPTALDDSTDLDPGTVPTEILAGREVPSPAQTRAAPKTPKTELAPPRSETADGPVVAAATDDASAAMTGLFGRTLETPSNTRHKSNRRAWLATLLILMIVGGTAAYFAWRGGSLTPESKTAELGEPPPDPSIVSLADVPNPAGTERVTPPPPPAQDSVSREPPPPPRHADLPSPRPTTPPDLTPKSATPAAKKDPRSSADTAANPPRATPPPKKPPAKPEDPPAAPAAASADNFVKAVRTSAAAPVYPAAAREAGLEGKVVVRAHIDATGTVSSTRVLRGVSPELDAAAMEAVAQWQFEPATREGKPVPDTLNTAIEFKLERPKPLQVGGDVKAPVRSPEVPIPAYTAEARSEGIVGTVELQAIIDETGRVVELEVRKGLSHGLTESALEAVQQWTFQPATRHGEPVTVSHLIKIRFQ